MTRFSLWYLIVAILALPLFAGIIPFIDRSFLNIFSSLTSLLLIAYIFRYHLFDYKSLLILVSIFLILFIQYSKTALEYGVSNGMATYMRYFLYFLLAYGISRRGLSRKEFEKILILSIIISLISIAIGIFGSRYMWTNAYLRLMGASHSPAALALQLSINLVLIAGYFSIIREKSYILNMKDYFIIFSGIIIFYAMLDTGSRQPLLGIISMLLFILFVYKTKYFFALVTAAGLYVFLAFDLSFLLDNRLIFTTVRILSVDINEFSDVRDGSILSRINYFVVGFNHVLENNFYFGEGLNAFPTIYYQNTGIPRVAPHNDFLLIFVEFGFVGLMIFLILFAFFFIKCLKRKQYFTLSILVFWLAGLSLNNSLYYHSVFILFLIILLMENKLNQSKRSNAI